MIIENRVTEIGDEIIFATDIPVTGITRFYDFFDDVLNETSERYFEKYFRFSVNALIFSSWLPLTLDSLKEFIVESNSTLSIEFRYLRAGIETGGELIFNQVVLIGDNTAVEDCSGIIKQKSILSIIACKDPEVNQLCNNLLEKFYQPGIIPRYIERGLDSEHNDKDYIAFWKTMCCYFAQLHVYAVRITDFTRSSKRFIEYLRQEGLFLCGDESYEEVDYIATNLMDEFRKRGTLQVFEKKQGNRLANGEFLRLICYKDTDEFILFPTTPKESGWNTSHSSPLFSSTPDSGYINKAYKKSLEFLSLSDYPITGTQYCSIVEDEGKKVLRIEFTAANQTVSIDGRNKRIVVDESMDYSLSFEAKYLQSCLTSFGVFLYDEDGNSIACKDLDEVNTNYFFQEKNIAFRNDWLPVRQVLFSKDALSYNSQKKTIFGNNLHSTANAQLCGMVLTFKSTQACVLYVKSLLFKPLVFGKNIGDNYNLCRIGSKNYINLWYKNNKKELTNEYIEEQTRRFLIPYKSHLKTVQL